MKQRDNIINTKNPSILSLHDDALISICQFLTMRELSKLEQCNSFLFQKIRASPQCIITLNYPSWMKYYCHQQKYKKSIHRIYFAKKVLLMRTFGYKENVFSLPNMSNISDLSIDNVDAIKECKCPSLATLTTFRISFQNIFSKLLPKMSCNLNSLHSLSINDYTHSSQQISTESIDTLLDSELNTLQINVEDKMNLEQYRYGHGWSSFVSSGGITDNTESCDISTNKDRKLWHHLHHFAYDKGSVNDNVGFHSSFQKDRVSFLCHAIISNCKNMRTLSLQNLRQNEFNIIFKYDKFDKIRWNCRTLTRIKLHISSPKICDLLQHLTDNKPELVNINLLAWDKYTDEENRNNGSQILNRIKDLLKQQLTNSDKLQDITLELHVDTDTMTRRMYDYEAENFVNKRLRLLYLMLIHVFNNDAIKYRKELNICIKQTLSGVDLPIDECIMDKLWNILNNKIECFTLRIEYALPYQKEFQPAKTTQFNLWLNAMKQKFGSTLDIGLTCPGPTYKYFVTNIVSADENCLLFESTGDDEDISNEEMRYNNNNDNNGKNIIGKKANIVGNTSFDNYPNIAPTYSIDLSQSDFFIPPIKSYTTS